MIVGFIVGFFLAVLFIHSSMPERDDFVPYYRYGQHVGTHDHVNENTSIAEKLYSEVRILCWIMTSPANHQKKARHVKRTWGKRCNKLIFMSSAKDEELDAVALPISEGDDNLWGKTEEAFKYVSDHRMNYANWFLTAQNDTYMIVKNLR
ncbi:GH23563 [Drosophila grimshawi]|uniref:GH23563 n=1 Tax=Drosophila grimshawi TaxID=7222 RepID=B4K414_DROGR|nr:GH23563 [Drosophila grimshawi]